MGWLGVASVIIATATMNLLKENYFALKCTNSKKYLFKKYEGFADKRVKDIKKDYSFRIDDYNEQYDSAKRFCSIFVRVVGRTTNFELTLTNNAPVTKKIERLVLTKGGNISETMGSIKVTLTPIDFLFVRKLAKQINSLVADGKKYKDPNWKWLCPRTAQSLKDFAYVIKDYKGEIVDKEPVRSKGFGIFDR